ncbi:hypothetical protein K7X08_003327 [Anisodus acutangulus]|uniref:Pectinesterase inhibitor domain-containing protein n=1 Tax=Anisodus acutangulus TaxID=402998 RepID=A0A9Q1MJ11_9SOLA|nr:hypothetical protein K7X08_003327 [Anisodus acutangulus]
MVGKIMVSLVSLILVVGVVLGVAIALHKGSKDDAEQSTKVQMKANIEEFCKPAEFQIPCFKSLDSVAKNDSATMKDYLLASLKVTGDEIKKSLEVVEKNPIDNKTDPYNHMAVEDCKELLQYAVEELQDSYSMVGDTELHSLGDRVSELLNWLGAVYSYQSMCLDSIDKPEYKQDLENGMRSATQLTHNAINIVAKISTVLQAFNVSSTITTSSNNHRRLLGYPTWFPVADPRKPLDNQFNTITADGKEIASKPGGVVFQNCRIVPEMELFPVRFQLASYLGRPWKPYATTVFMESELGDFIRPEGWMIWQGASFEQTCHYYEFANRGPGAIINNRNKSFRNFRLLNPIEAAKYTVDRFINGNDWLRYTGAPYYLGLGGR